jgi:hypothetical protein
VRQSKVWLIWTPYSALPTIVLPSPAALPPRVVWMALRIVGEELVGLCGLSGDLNAELTVAREDVSAEQGTDLRLFAVLDEEAGEAVGHLDEQPAQVLDHSGGVAENFVGDRTDSGDAEPVEHVAAEHVADAAQKGDGMDRLGMQAEAAQLGGRADPADGVVRGVLDGDAVAPVAEPRCAVGVGPEDAALNGVVAAGLEHEAVPSEPRHDEPLDRAVSRRDEQAAGAAAGAGSVDADERRVGVAGL